MAGKIIGSVGILKLTIRLSLSFFFEHWDFKKIGPHPALFEVSDEPFTEKTSENKTSPNNAKQHKCSVWPELYTAFFQWVHDRATPVNTFLTKNLACLKCVLF